MTTRSIAEKRRILCQYVEQLVSQGHYIGHAITKPLSYYDFDKLESHIESEAAKIEKFESDY